MSRVSLAEGIVRCAVKIFQDVTLCDKLHREISGCYMVSYMT